MHNLIVVSSCINNAFIKTRRVLDNYGYRISQKTWSLKITEKALKEIILELKRGASKNTSLSFFRKDEEIIHIGNNKRMNGKYAITIKQIKKKDDFLLELSALSAEMHDIGKSMSYFQNILNGKSKISSKYFVRHEYFSIIIIEFLFQDKLNFIDFIKMKIENEKFIEDSDSYLFKSLLMLIATHHKLPDYENFIKNNSFLRDSKENIINLLNENKNEKICLLSDYQLKQIKDKVTVFLNKYSELSVSEIDANIHMARNIIILSDHIGSGIKVSKKTNKRDDPKTLLAKSEGSIYENSDKTDKQTLSEHLKLVKAQTGFVKNVISGKIQPFFKYEDFFIKDFVFEKIDKLKYKWQEDSINFVNVNMDKNKPFFNILSSSTGSGKTRFTAKLNALISKKNRLCILQGLRTLTLQTSDSYKNLSIFDKSEIKTAIGSRKVKQLFEMLKEDTNEDEECDITEDIKMDSYYKKRNIKGFHYYLNANKQSFLDTPILIATIDYIIKACDHRKTYHMDSHLRLITSDIVIDEVDNFDLNDLKSIKQLAYLIGFYRCNLTLSTATAMPALINNLYYAYRQGIEESSCIYKKDSDFNVFYINDNNNDIKKDEESFEDFLNKNAEITVNKTVSLNKVEVKNINIENIIDHAVMLHNNSHSVYENKKISIGMIRVANIKEATALAITFSNANVDNFYTETILYHSQFSLIERSKIEKLLDDNLQRSVKKVNELSLIEPHLSKNVENICIFIVVTPVEEVGRDHDFDWAIIEPSSSRSIAQTAGRVYRHRTYTENCANIYVINENFKMQKGKSLTYVMPGLETSANKFEINGSSCIGSLVADFSNLANNKNIIKINKDKNMLAYFENANVEKELKKFNYSKKEDIFKYRFVKNKESGSSGFFNKFREGEENITVFLNQSNHMCYFNENGEILKIDYKNDEFNYKINTFLNIEGPEVYKNIKDEYNIIKSRASKITLSKNIGFYYS